MRFVAGQGAGAQSHREDVAGRGTDAEVFLAGALQRRAIGKMLLAEGAAVAEILLAGRREGRKWSLPQPVARILLCGALPEFKVKNLLLQCTYNGTGRDFLPHFNRNPA